MKMINVRAGGFGGRKGGRRGEGERDEELFLYVLKSSFITIIRVEIIRFNIIKTL